MDTLLVLPGDGIGPEITEATVGVLEAAFRRFHLSVRLEHAAIGLAALEKQGEEELVDAMAAKLVRSPEHFDVVLSTNMYADLIERAVDHVLADPAKRTADLGGRCGTRAFAEAVAAAP